MIQRTSVGNARPGDPSDAFRADLLPLRVPHGHQSWQATRRKKAIVTPSATPELPLPPRMSRHAAFP